MAKNKGQLAARVEEYTRQIVFNITPGTLDIEITIHRFEALIGPNGKVISDRPLHVPLDPNSPPLQQLTWEQFSGMMSNRYGGKYADFKADMLALIEDLYP